ncbi:hypothetical protein Tco_1030611 [Tanacetum coccineum]|uniref:Xylulose kinase-1 n=1 Tax=Tanacetum coccineum TaxID=301880 RepID=A0ABQ5G854_9ASTR
MANLEFYDTYNMVAYIKKPEESEGFHQIVDFLNASHIRYAFIENPTIYVSLIKQFWETTTAKTLDNGEIKLTATTDGKVKIVTEASVRRHLQLADSDGSTHLVESHHTPTSAPSTSQPPISPTSRRTNRHESVGATTTVTGLEAGQGSGNIDKTPTMPQDSPLLRVNTLGSDEGSMTLQELMVLCTTLSKKVESLEIDLKQTKLTYGAAYTKLIKKVKKLENKVKSSQARRRAKIIVSDDEDDLEDPSKQGRKIAEIDQDLPFHCTAEKDVRTAKPVTTASVAVSTAKEKGKAKMD